MKRSVKYLSALVATMALCAAAVHRGPTPLKLVYPSYFGNRINIPADNPTTKEGVALGRTLFYETALSANGRLSCGTCHQQRLAFTDGKRFSTGVDGQPMTRNSMSLANLLWVRNLFWDGRAKSLEAQAAIPLTEVHEMGQRMDLSVKKLEASPKYRLLFKAAFGNDTITEAGVMKAIAQFERTLISAGSKYDAYLQGAYVPTESERNGMTLFFTAPNPAKAVRGAGCGHCHGGPKTFVELFHNNGLDGAATDKGRQAVTGQPMDEGRFRVPTLRNIALTAPYMHDGRLKSLEAVIEHYNSGLQQGPLLSGILRDNANDAGGKSLNLTAREKKDLLAFLHLLTDSTFVNNAAFSNPHAKN